MLADDGGGAADESGDALRGSYLGSESERGLDINEAALEQSKKEGVFAGEVGVEEAGGELGFEGNGFDGGVGEAVAGEQEEGGVEEPVAGGGAEELILGGRAGHSLIID